MSVWYYIMLIMNFFLKFLLKTVLFRAIKYSYSYIHKTDTCFESPLRVFEDIYLNVYGYF